MNVLCINKFFYPKGGSEAVFFGEARLLEEAGHSACFFSMHHPQNLPSPFEAHFVSEADYSGNDSLLGRLRLAGRLLYSLEARGKLGELLRRERPDLAHLHNIHHQLSPSIIDLLHGRRVPMVMTLHDYKMVCPTYSLLCRGAVCQRCAGGRYYQAVLGCCTKGSRLQSTLNALEMYLHHTLLGIYGKVVTFISPSRFLAGKLREMGFRGRVVHLPNFVDPAQFAPSFEAQEESIVYFGRLSREKGLRTLLEAARGLKCEVKVIGDGPLRAELEAKRPANVSFLGFQSGQNLHEEIRRSAVVVAPSEWYENNPLSVIEAFALGKPVVGARIGGIPELVRDGETGCTFEAGNAADLRAKVERLLAEPEAAADMGRRARGWVERELSPERHYEGLMSIYEEAGRARA